MNIETAAYLRAVSLGKKAFYNEHTKLVHVLKKGSKQEQQDEADKQAKELQEVTSGGPGSGRHPGFGSMSPPRTENPNKGVRFFNAPQDIVDKLSSHGFARGGRSPSSDHFQHQSKGRIEISDQGAFRHLAGVPGNMDNPYRSLGRGDVDDLDKHLAKVDQWKHAPGAYGVK